jgi:hypothetical protein
VINKSLKSTHKNFLIPHRKAVVLRAPVKLKKIMRMIKEHNNTRGLK